MRRHFFTAALFTSLSFSAQSAEPTKQDLTREAKQLMQSYAQQLKAALGGAMKTGGPMAAIDACAQKSLRLLITCRKNPAGPLAAPAKNKEIQRVNQMIGKRIFCIILNSAKNGEAIKPMAQAGYSEDKSEFRFMKAIPTQDICLTCHGSEIDPKIKSHIAEYYPDDKATGYQKGDIRGAFVLIKELKKSK